jgi:putative hydrolase of the HAD superfamily
VGAQQPSFGPGPQPVRPEPVEGPAIRALLFDLGGVVIEIDFGRALAHWAGYSELSPDELRAAFWFDAAYEKHERGEIGWAQYLAHLRATLRLGGTDAQIEEGWNSIFIAEIPATVAMVDEARKLLPCYGFSNTNPTHQAHWAAAFPRAAGAFERIFVSWELGLRKPERAAFDMVCEQMGVAPGEVLFFDDTAENVEGARAAGLQAVWVRGPGDVRAALEALADQNTRSA